MKNIFGFTIALFSLAMVSCQNENIEQPASYNTIPVSFEVNIPNDHSRSITDAYGTSEAVNRCILQVYSEGKPYGERKVVKVENSKAVYEDMRFEVSHSYKFVFWADCGDENMADKYYSTQDMRAIAFKAPYAGNNTELNAFTSAEDIMIKDVVALDGITLTRPFAMLKVKTNDLDKVKSESLKPASYKVKFTEFPTQFDAYRGEAKAKSEVSYTANVLDEKGLIAVDYIFANESQLLDFSMSFINKENKEITSNDKFKNIPAKRNQITSISGNLITKSGGVDITIDPDMDSKNEQNK